MKQIILIAIAILALSSCNKQTTCTCTIHGQNKHEITGLNETDCQAYEASLPDRECTFDN
jgi:PBP1b-binding outer membrane lipoprotein LpoB